MEASSSAHSQRKHLPFAAFASQRELIIAGVESTRIEACFESGDVVADLRDPPCRCSGSQVLVENSNLVHAWRCADWQQYGRIHPRTRHLKRRRIWFSAFAARHSQWPQV